MIILYKIIKQKKIAGIKTYHDHSSHHNDYTLQYADNKLKDDRNQEKHIYFKLHISSLALLSHMNRVLRHNINNINKTRRQNNTKKNY